MARARNIKPGFFANDVLAECEPLARILFAGLWTVADRCGRLEDRPKKLKAGLLPYDDCDMESLLSQLADRKFIERYSVDGEAYIQISTWDKHQNPHVKEAASEIPAPDKNSAATVLPPDGAQPIPERAGLIPESGFLIPDSPIQGGGAVAQSPTKLGEVCKAIRAKGIPDVSPGNPLLQALVERGVPVETFEAAAETCAKSKPPKGVNYLISIVQRQINEAAAIAAGPAVVASVDPDAQSVVEAEGIAKGIGPWDPLKEQWHPYKARVRSAPAVKPLDLNALAGMAAQRTGVTV